MHFVKKKCVVEDKTVKNDKLSHINCLSSKIDYKFLRKHGINVRRYKDKDKIENMRN
jgi:hypothetical protein